MHGAGLCCHREKLVSHCWPREGEGGSVREGHGIQGSESHSRGQAGWGSGYFRTERYGPSSCTREVGLKVNVLCKVKLEKSYNFLASLLGRHCIRE